MASGVPIFRSATAMVVRRRLVRTGAHHCPCLKADSRPATASVPAAGPIAAIDSIAAAYTCGSAPGSMRRSTNAKNGTARLSRSPMTSLASVCCALPVLVVSAVSSSADASSLPFSASPWTASRRTSGSASVKQRHQLLQPFGAAEFTQEVCRRASHLPVRRIHQLLHGLAAAGAESKEHFAKPTTGAGVLLAGEHFGQRGDDGRAHRVADPLEALVALVVDTAQVRGDVLHHRAAAKLLECRARVRLPPGIGGALVEHRFDELPRVIEVADANEIVRVRGDGLGDIAPAQRIGLDRRGDR